MESEGDSWKILNLSSSVLVRISSANPSSHRLLLLFRASTDLPTFYSITVLIEELVCT